MKLSTLLKLQLIYCIAGIGYNVVSAIVVMNGGQQLSTTMPLKGGLVMTAYGLCLLPALFDKILLYRILMVVCIIGLGYGGILLHLINWSTDPSMYPSVAAWALAAGINVYGIILNIIAALGKFRTGESAA